jgi:hypothetical protein
LIWSDVSAQQPDIFLSIGTGHHGPNPKDKALETRRLQRSTGESNIPEYVPQPEVQTRSTTTLLPFTGHMWNMAAGRVDNILNCTKTWDNFRLDILEPYSGSRRRYIRLNPDLRFKVPSLDEVDRLNDLRTAVAKEMQQNARIKEVAHRLVASTFFFEKVDSSTKENQDRFECKGGCYESLIFLGLGSRLIELRLHMLPIRQQQSSNEGSRSVPAQISHRRLYAILCHSRR